MCVYKGIISHSEIFVNDDFTWNGLFRSHSLLRAAASKPKKIGALL